jgi:hypothetical protein
LDGWTVLTSSQRTLCARKTCVLFSNPSSPSLRPGRRKTRRQANIAAAAKQDHCQKNTLCQMLLRRLITAAQVARDEIAAIRGCATTQCDDKETAADEPETDHEQRAVPRLAELNVGAKLRRPCYAAASIRCRHSLPLPAGPFGNATDRIMRRGGSCRRPLPRPSSAICPAPNENPQLLGRAACARNQAHASVRESPAQEDSNLRLPHARLWCRAGSRVRFGRSDRVAPNGLEAEITS